jgi:WD40 repeat protein
MTEKDSSNPFTGKVKGQCECRPSFLFCTACSPDAKILAAGGWEPAFEGEVLLWDAATGMLKAKIERHDKKVNCVAFSPDGNTLASGSDDGTVKLWDVSGL